MKHAEYGFAGDDVDIEETITRHYKVKFLDYEIARSMALFNEKEKIRIIKYLMKLNGNKKLFHPVFRKLTKESESQLIESCKKSPKRWSKDDFFIVD